MLWLFLLQLSSTHDLRLLHRGEQACQASCSGCQFLNWGVGSVIAASQCTGHGVGRIPVKMVHRRGRRLRNGPGAANCRLPAGGLWCKLTARVPIDVVASAVSATGCGLSGRARVHVIRSFTLRCRLGLYDDGPGLRPTAFLNFQKFKF